MNVDQLAVLAVVVADHDHSDDPAVLVIQGVSALGDSEGVGVGVVSGVPGGSAVQGNDIHVVDTYESLCSRWFSG